MTSGVFCGGDYSAVFQESFYSLMSNSGPRFQANQGSIPSGRYPPMCNGNGAFVGGINEIGSCDYPCPKDYEKHFFIQFVNGEEKDFCCCGECSK